MHLSGHFTTSKLLYKRDRIIRIFLPHGLCGSWQHFASILVPCQSSTVSWTSHPDNVNIGSTRSTSTVQGRHQHRMVQLMAQTCMRRSTKRKRMMMTKRERKRRKRKRRRNRSTVLNTQELRAVTQAGWVCEKGNNVGHTLRYCILLHSLFSYHLWFH